MVARYRLLDRAKRLPLASLAYSVLIEDGAMGKLLALELGAEDRAEAIADLRSTIDGLEALEEIYERLHGSKPLLSYITSSLDTLRSGAAVGTEPPTSRAEPLN